MCLLGDSWAPNRICCRLTVQAYSFSNSRHLSCQMTPNSPSLAFLCLLSPNVQIRLLPKNYFKCSLPHCLFDASCPFLKCQRNSFFFYAFLAKLITFYHVCYSLDAWLKPSIKVKASEDIIRNWHSAFSIVVLSNHLIKKSKAEKNF